MIGFLVDSTFCLREIKRNIVGGTWLITFIHDWSDTQWKQGTNNFEHIIFTSNKKIDLKNTHYN